MIIRGRDLVRPIDGSPSKVGVEPFLEGGSYNADAGLDVRLGTWFLAPRAYSESRIDLKSESEDGFGGIHDAHPLLAHRSLKPYYVNFGKHYVLHPRSFVLAATLEWVTLPGNLAAYVVGKSSLGRRGLVVATATGVQPRFSGCITLELSNLGEVPLTLYPGMKVAQLFFHEVQANPDQLTTLTGSHVGYCRPSGGFYKLDAIALKLADLGKTS